MKHRLVRNYLSQAVAAAIGMTKFDREMEELMKRDPRIKRVQDEYTIPPDMMDKLPTLTGRTPSSGPSPQYIVVDDVSDTVYSHAQRERLKEWLTKPMLPDYAKIELRMTAMHKDSWTDELLKSLAYVNEADTPEERRKRKTEMFYNLYARKP